MLTISTRTKDIVRVRLIQTRGSSQKKLNKQASQAGFCDVEPRLHVLVVKAVAADRSVKSKALPNDGVLKKTVLENDSKADSTTRPCEEIFMFEEITNITLFNKKNYKMSILIGAVSTEMHPFIYVFETGAGPNLIGENVRK